MKTTRLTLEKIQSMSDVAFGVEWLQKGFNNPQNTQKEQNYLKNYPVVLEWEAYGLV